MGGIPIPTRLVINIGLSRYAGITAAILLGAVAVSAHAADNVEATGGQSFSKDQNTRGTRIFSKDRPLFGANQQIPSVTPDRSGNTKVKVIVRPTEPDRQTTAAENVEELRSRGSRQPTPQLDDHRGDGQRPQKADVSTAGHQESSGRRTGAISGSELNRGKDELSSALLPTANPRRLVQQGSAQREQSQINQVRKVKVKSRLRAGSITPRQVKRRRRVARRPSNRVHRFRRHYRRPYWRQFAPPGTVHSFVRCWPGEPCIRYYRVRRPRTLRQYRRLLAWQRRQDARLRYRRRYGHY